MAIAAMNITGNTKGIANKVRLKSRIRLISSCVLSCATDSRVNSGVWPIRVREIFATRTLKTSAMKRSLIPSSSQARTMGSASSSIDLGMAIITSSMICCFKHSSTLSRVPMTSTSLIRCPTRVESGSKYPTISTPQSACCSSSATRSLALSPVPTTRTFREFFPLATDRIK